MKQLIYLFSICNLFHDVGDNVLTKAHILSNNLKSSVVSIKVRILREGRGQVDFI